MALKMVVEDALEITDATFDVPHPNPGHLPGVIYDPAKRYVRIPRPEGDLVGLVGDWISRRKSGALTIVTRGTLAEITERDARAQRFQYLGSHPGAVFRPPWLSRTLRRAADWLEGRALERLSEPSGDNNCPPERLPEGG